MRKEYSEWDAAHPKTTTREIGVIPGCLSEKLLDRQRIATKFHLGDTSAGKDGLPRDNWLYARLARYI